MADCKESKEEENPPAFLLKVDPPKDSSDDSTENSTNDDMETKAEKVGNSSDASDSESQKSGSKQSNYSVFSRNRIAASKFGNSFGSGKLSNSSGAKPRSMILRPSQLAPSGSLANSNPTPTKSVLQPAKFQNPFGKVPDNSILEDPATKENKKTSEESKEPKKAEEKPVADVTKPKFLPLGVGASTKESEHSGTNSNNVNSTVESSGSEPSFVFGQNLKERVAVASEESAEKSEAEEPKKEESNENGSSELLFSSAASACRSTARPGLTLSQAAQELEEANRANKRKYSEVTLLTGEEGETNVLQINCKLFAFDKASSGWQERGRGTLRLNDLDEESRLVVRTTGTQKVILNTKIWPAMTAERAGPKSLRLTAMDVNGDIRIFIVQAGPKETEQLHSQLLPRIKRAQERQPKKLASNH